MKDAREPKPLPDTLTGHPATATPGADDIHGIEPREGDRPRDGLGPVPTETDGARTEADLPKGVSAPDPAVTDPAATRIQAEAIAADADAARAAALDPSTTARELGTVDSKAAAMGGSDVARDPKGMRAAPELAGTAADPTVARAAGTAAVAASTPRANAKVEIDPADGSKTAPYASRAEARARLLTTALPFGWKGMLIFGILTALGGIAAILSPFLASLTVAAFAAATFVILGAATLWMAFKGESEVVPHRLMNGALGMLMIAFGVLLFANPLAGLLSLTILVAAFFVAEGAMRVYLGARNRERPGAGWLIFGGVVSLALGAMVFLGLPSSSLVLLGLFLGIDLLGTGIAMIALSVSERKATGDKAAPEDPRFA